MEPNPRLDLDPARGAGRLRRFLASLRFRLVLLVALAMLAALGQTVYTSWERRRDAKDAAQAHVLELARLAAANLEGLVEGTRQILISLSLLPQVRGGDPAACQALLRDVLDRFSLYAGFGLRDARGQVSCSAFQVGAPADLADTTLFARARDSRDFAIGSYRVGNIPGKATLELGYPVMDASGEVQGVVFGALDLAWLDLLAARARLPESSVWTLFHRDGTILARYPDPERWVGRRLPNAPVVRLALAETEGTAEKVGLDSVPRLYGFRPLQGAVGSDDLHVSIGVPLADVSAVMNRALARNLALLGLVGVLALVGSAVVGEAFVLRPVEALLRATRRLSQGDLDARTGPPYSGGELGQLARAFDDMAGALAARHRDAARAEEDLRRSRDELEERVAARTLEISQANERLRLELDERLRVTEALRASEARFKAFMDHSPAVAFLKDEEGRFVYANKRMEDMFHIRTDDLHEKTSGDLFSEEIAERTQEQDRIVLSSGKSLELNQTLPTADGTLRHWIAFKFPVEAESGRRLVGAVAIDVTARREAEEALLRANEELKGWVAELEQRTREITLLSEMADLLQSCQTPEEAYSVIATSCQQIFPHHAGALCMFAPSNDVVESVAVWGMTGVLVDRVFQPDDCWALRRGQPHAVTGEGSELLCRHVHPSPRPYLCVPMLGQGKSLGILHLETEEAYRHLREAYGPVRKLASAVADQVALAIANMRLRETLRSQAIRDPLTGLYNRRYMEESLEREIHRATRRHSALSVVMLDLDGFKGFNDAFGHAAGDTLLREIGSFLRSRLRAEDIACRYGGEEFTLILPDADIEHTRNRAEELRLEARKLSVVHHGQMLAAITLSLGIAAYPEHGASADELLNAADAALYEAKSSGRNRVVVAAPGPGLGRAEAAPVAT